MAPAPTSNLLLFLLFLAEQKRRLSSEDVERLDIAVAQWREAVVKPLRDLRRGLKQGIDFMPGPVSETFRSQIKRLELESEQIEQHRLEELAAAGIRHARRSRMEAAENNIALYCHKLRNAPADAVAAILRGFAEFVPIEPPIPG